MCNDDWNIDIEGGQKDALLRRANKFKKMTALLPDFGDIFWILGIWVMRKSYKSDNRLQAHQNA